MVRSGGLLDLQVNGFAGVDFNDPAITLDALDHALHAMLETGVTACLPTVITASPDALADRFAALDRAVSRSRLGPLMVPGYHLEGPFLNPGAGYTGCHPAQEMTAPECALVQRIAAPLARPILLLTLAPELDGAEALIRWARSSGRLVGLGHTAARFADIGRAADAGATLCTHLGNALAPNLPKFDNPLIAQLAEDRLSAGFIADGVHIPPHALKVLIRAKGLERSILVTDATAAAAAPPGTYRFAGMWIEHTTEGVVRLPGTARLAGSALTLDRAVRNVVEWGIADRAGAIGMASAIPAARLAPALAAHHLALPDAEVAWSPDLQVLGARVGEVSVTRGGRIGRSGGISVRPSGQ